MPSQRALFESQQTLEAFCEKIVLPNMTLRTFEEELFEDDPAEYVRRDLDTAGKLLPWSAPEMGSRKLTVRGNSNRQRNSAAGRERLQQGLDGAVRGADHSDRDAVHRRISAGALPGTHSGRGTLA